MPESNDTPTAESRANNKRGSKKSSLIIVIFGSILVLGMIIGIAFKFGESSPIVAKGSIELDESLFNAAEGIRTLYLVFHDSQSKMPMPYGAVRFNVDGVPKKNFFEFTVTPEKLNVMIEGAPPPKSFRIKARIDNDGMAGMDKSGDLVGIVQDVAYGSNDILIKIESRVE